MSKIYHYVSFYWAKICILKHKNISWNYFKNLYLGVSPAPKSQPAPS